MNDDNNHNILFFEGASMRELHATMEGWQNANKKRFLSMSIQKEGEGFCCIALTNPSEVIIVGKKSQYGSNYYPACVNSDGQLITTTRFED